MFLVMLNKQQKTVDHPTFAFSDSSWQDDVAEGRSTGGFYILYMGGVVDMSSNLPQLVAHSSTDWNMTKHVLCVWQTVI